MLRSLIAATCLVLLTAAPSVAEQLTGGSRSDAPDFSVHIALGAGLVGLGLLLRSMPLWP